MSNSSKPASKIADDYQSKIRGMELHLKRIQKLYRDKEITHTDLKRIYSGSFIQFYATLEQTIERLFIGLLMGSYKSSYSQVRTLVKIRSYQVAHEVIKSERPYVNWLPYKENTIARAKSFFSSGKPFTLLKNTQTQTLRNVRYIRNALAHNSSSSLKKFRTKVTSHLSLPKKQLNPREFLVANPNRGTNQTRLYIYLIDSVNIIYTLC